MIRILGAFSLMLALVSPALPCGMFFPSTLESPSSMNAQHVLLVWKEATIDMHVQVVASGGAESFAWVLPVAENPQVALGSNDVFADLQTYTAPLIHFPEPSPSGGGGGCGAVDAAGANFKAGGDLQGVLSLATGELGNYSYDVVKASSADEMIQWLTAEGYAIPEGSAAALTPYVSAGMAFLWARLKPDTTEEELLSLDPLVLTVPRPVNSQLMFPLALSASSGDKTMETKIFTLAEKRYRASNYGSTELQTFANFVLQEGWFDYNEALDELTRQSAGKLMLTEFAKDLRTQSDVPDSISALMGDQSFYLTRLHARTPVENLTDAILTFAADAAEVNNEVTASHNTAPAALPAALLLVLLFGRRRRP
jgi:hypothetical protein